MILCMVVFARPVLAQKELPPLDSAMASFVIANAEFTLVHELMHVLIDEAGVPVLAREEDQADYLAAITLLSQKSGFPGDPKKPAPGAADWPIEGGPLAPAVITRMQAILDAWRVEWTISEQDNMELPYADPHAMEIQRLFDMACLTYGRDPERLKDFKIANELPGERADLCAEDFAKAERGLEFIKTTLKNSATSAKGAGDFEIRLIYDHAVTSTHQQYKAWLENASIIKPLIDAINRDYYLPRAIAVRFRPCGQVNAYWEPKDAQVNMCYELLDRFVHLTRFYQQYAVERRKTVLGTAKAKGAFD